MQKRMIALTVALLNTGVLATVVVVGFSWAGLDFWTVFGFSSLSVFFVLMLVWTYWMFSDLMKGIRSRNEIESHSVNLEALDGLRSKLVMWAVILPIIGVALALTGEVVLKDEWPWLLSFICIVSGALATPFCLFLSRRLNSKDDERGS